MIAFTVPGPVRGKGRPRTRVVGTFATIYTDAKTRNYEAEVRFHAQQAMNGAALMEGPLSARLVARFAIPATGSKRRKAAMLAGDIRPTVKPDADNVAKILDALNGVVFGDDKQVCDLSLRKVYAATPGLDVVIERLAEEEAI